MTDYVCMYVCIERERERERLKIRVQSPTLRLHTDTHTHSLNSLTHARTHSRNLCLSPPSLSLSFSLSGDRRDSLTPTWRVLKYRSEC
jgi:hypothetical protein